MEEFFAAAEYGTPKGNIRNWSGTVSALNIDDARGRALERLKTERRVARLFILKVYAPTAFAEIVARAKAQLLG
jgi:hypothetical protein